MEDLDTSLPKLGLLVEQRVELARQLAGSLESSTLALARNDAEAIARGAAHQAELCRQWSVLEGELRQHAAAQCLRTAVDGSRDAAGEEKLARLQAEWDALSLRISHLARVHWSLLRHLERSLAIVNRVVSACSATYAPVVGGLRSDPPAAGGEIRCQV